ncbi:lipase family alpha/beta hydrolase [Agitococcus lubricus]|uniref:Triacylglycerol lipase n=1 Tax=Agitococcus lubricus TaxID=1077255 RepID=A0A2T5J328_9GAMM|nr:triacylglycerol lipase [Agitococcus lubricus]PTQ90976.1 triacylglycerol lipase [Agitococcus lubricus]
MNKNVLLSSVIALSSLVSLSAEAALFTNTYAKTKYPIVLVHGLFGFSKIGNAVDYFYQVPADLKNNGAVVFTPQVAAVNSNEARGEQLLTKVQDILAISGAAKINLIGHSQGGPTARYVAGVIPTRVASVSTIAGVHKGTPVADVLLGLADMSKFTEKLVFSITEGIGGLVDGVSSEGGYSQDARASLTSLSTKGSLAFNAKFPAGVPSTACGEGTDKNGQKFYSWMGTSQATNPLDPLEPFLILASAAFLGEDNDTLVGRCSSHFGKVIKDNYAWNHLDEVNQVFGLRGVLSADPVDVLRQHANRLKLAGL